MKTLRSTLLFLIRSNLLVAQSNKYHITQTFHIQSAGSWDYLAICPESNQLYVSHGEQVNVLDKDTV